jgi:hypothetical protein
MGTAMQHVPSKPDYLTSEDFAFILNRDSHRCALYGKCPRANGNAYCDEELDFDHEQPTALGGDDSLANVRLLCSSHNRGRPVEPIDKWSKPSYWDNEVVPNKLREIQRLAGWDEIALAIEGVEPEKQKHLRRTLLGSTTFLAGATGIGKAILCQSVLFRINQVIGNQFPRVKHVLWLTNDTTLRDVGKTEIEEDAYAIGFVSARPVVHIARGFSDIDAGPNKSDVKVAAAQSLWEVEKSNRELRRSPDEVRHALIGYDTIIFDECDWASDQVRHIARLGNHALQFSLTASPPIEEITDSKERAEDFLKRFVLITPQAVADYERARRLDACLKIIDDDVIIAAPHDAHTILERGEVKNLPERAGPDHVLFRSAICQAVRQADNLETRMKNISEGDYYSPHVMVRMSTIAEARAMHADMVEQLRTMRDRNQLKNRGWDVSMIFQGHERYLEKGARKIESNLNSKHPFMLASRDGGVATDKSKRVLIMCKIGVRGINNWTISHIVDCTNIMSITEAIQFNYGRPLRWRDREDWVDTETKENKKIEFASTRIYIPQSGVHINKREALLKAADFIKNMASRISGAGFMTWVDLLHGRKVTDVDVRIEPTNRPLTDTERFQVQKSLADVTGADDVLTQKTVEDVIVRWPISGKLREKLIEYGLSLAAPKARQKEIGAKSIVDKFKEKPACVMEKLQPQDKYEIDDLVRWIKSDPDYDDAHIRDEYIDQLRIGSKLAVHAVSQRLRDVQVANYRPAARTRRLQGHGDERGVLPELAAELWGKLKNADQACDIGLVNQAINGAANRVFQISAEEAGPMDHPAYHIAILGRYRDTLQRIARSQLIGDGQLGLQLKRFAGL